jgi:hypothetical protein
VTDPRCNDRCHHCLGAIPGIAPIVVLQRRFRNSLELEQRLVPAHLSLSQRARRRWVSHRKNHKPVNAIRVRRSRQLCHRGSPVVTNDVRGFDSGRVENAGHIDDHILKRIRGHSFRPIGAPEATLVRCDGAEVVRDVEWNLVAPRIRRVRPSV